MASENSSAKRTIDQSAFMAILNSRKTIARTHIGLQVLLAVQGTGTFLPKGHKYTVNGKERENEFDRTIYNLRANSQISMQRDENRKLVADAMKAESAGDVDKATELYNQYLNNVQVSFSVVERGGTSRQFASGDMVTAVVAESTNVDTGSTQLVVNDVRYKAPATIESAKFDITELVGEL